MVCLGLLMLSTYRYPPSAGVMSKCSSHYQCTIFFPLRNVLQRLVGPIFPYDSPAT